MQIINPSTILPLVYLIQDHTDTNTYYVRSVIKDTRNGTVLKTVDLTDGGDRRFTGTFSVPAAEETYIDITTTVYSDAGYTTKAPDKYEENSQYLVKTQWGLQFGGAGGPGERIDYKKIGNMIAEAISKMEKAKDYDDSSIIKSLNGLKEAISNIKEPDLSDMKPKPVDFSPVIAKLNEVSNKIQTIIEKSDEIYNKEFPIPEKFDYQGMLEATKEIIRNVVTSSIKDIENNMDKKESILKEVLPKIKEQLLQVEGFMSGEEKSNPMEKLFKNGERIKNLLGGK